MNFYHLGLWLIYPALPVLIICAFLIFGQAYQSDYDYEPDQYRLNYREKLIFILFKLCWIPIIIGLSVWAVDSYQKGYGWLTLILYLTPLYIFWDCNKDSSND